MKTDTKSNTKERRAAAERVRQYWPLVKKVVNGMRGQLPGHADLEELESVGTYGLAQALEKYDATQGATFEGYARLRIRGAILDELRRMDALPRTARRKLRDMNGVVGEMEQELGRTPTDEELRGRMGLDGEEFARLRRQTENRQVISLDRAVETADSEGVNLHERIADEAQETGLAVVERQEQLRQMVAHLEALPERMRKVVALYYHEGLLLSEIAAVFGVTEARICQIHTQALQLLRKSLRAEIF